MPGNEKRADLEAILMSQASASSRPMPAASPLMAAMTGQLTEATGPVNEKFTGVLRLKATSRQKAGPLPVMTAALIPVSKFISSQIPASSAANSAVGRADGSLMTANPGLSRVSVTLAFMAISEPGQPARPAFWL
jgi:hypothetical protein